MVIEDLGPDERKVYNFLRDEGKSPLSKVTAGTKMEFVKLFNVIKELKEKGYVKMSSGADGIPYYSAVPLEEIE